MTPPVLAVNCGSSTLKYAMFANDAVILRGMIERVGTGGVADHGAAVTAMFDELDRRGAARPVAVGHRLVHGGTSHFEPAVVDAALLAALDRAVSFAPLHLPNELAAIAAVRSRFGDMPQVACFDTGFHQTLPEIARRFPLPAALFDAGIRRYGFHGLSFEYVAASLPAATLRRAVIAHLGGGASMVALRDGRSVETTMGLTPTGGLVMATRSGDLDPGVLLYLLEHGHDARALARLVDHRGGMLALSGTTGDMKQLLELRGTDVRATLAIDVFCYQARKAIGGLAAVLGGIDTLVFTGGMHAHVVRAEICRGLEHLGIELDDVRNNSAASVISTASCEVCIVATDEERMIARHTRRLAS